eukprot:scaffold1174_cov281-Chaetoceros_neogracile.AAC.20
MGKRKTAKTGDKALYNARAKQDNSHNSKSVENDNMYNEVDRYNNARDELQDDMLTFEQKDDSDEEGVLNDVEGVMDLGLEQSDDESDSASDDSEEGSPGEDEPSPRRPLQAEENNDDDDDDDDDSIEDFNEEETDVLDWGKRKRDYYHGDTADLEIMERKEAVEDAELEEEGAKEILKARMEGMTEDDFMLDNDDDDDDDTDGEKANEQESNVVEMMTDEMQSTKRRKLSKLSKKDKIKLMNKTHPELLPLVSHFRDAAIKPCAEKTSVVVNALLHNEENAEAVGATNTGLQYLLTKAMIQTATALNVCQYLMIKADLARSALNDEDSNGFDDEDIIKNHPVISRLNQLNHLTDKLDSKVESKVNNLNNQFENLVKASSLMQGDDDENEEGDDNSETDMEQVANGNVIDYDAMLQAKEEIHATSDSGDESSSSDEDDEEVATMQKRLMNEARFAHRKQDDEEDDKGGSKRRRRRALPSFSDFGDEDNADEGDLAAAGKSLATTINRISQRSKSGDKVNVAPEVNDEVDEDRFNRGLEMMEAELGGENNIEGADIDADSIDEDGDDFYSQIQKKSQARKDFKKNMYAVAPKYPGLDNEIEGERAVGNMIMKNRGLVAHKNRLNRNPRVKKREQYRKALIKRKGAVREVRTDEGHKYGGETTGVKSGISRSRKLGVK